MTTLNLDNVELTKYLFFTGKGGVGKTTISSSIALNLAENGKKVALVSTDPASNLQDVFQMELSNKLTTYQPIPNLSIANFDPIAAADDYKAQAIEPYEGILPEDVLSEMKEQLSGSCTVEVAAFNEFTNFLSDKTLEQEFDFIIFDTSILSPLYQNPGFTFPLVTKEELERYGLTGRLLSLIDTVSGELARKEPFYQEVVASSLQTFWALLKRFHPRTDSETLPDDRRSRMLSDLQELVSYIDIHYADNITLEYAAGRMNFSTSHFSKTFKKLMGINFVTYLNVVRVERAAYELRHTEKKITDIALNCGFNNIRTFNRVFKEITGCTPSEFLLLPDPDTYKRTYYNRRSSEKEFVKDDSLTLVKNFESENS